MTNGFLELLPIYPLIAQQFLDDYQVFEGKCLDIGTGPGYLGVELAKITNLEMYFVDIDPEALEKARLSAAAGELANTIHFVEADVCRLPFEDDYADFIMSRGSLWFWHDQVKGLQEVYRVLKPGATAVVGGGLGKYTPESMYRRLKEGRQKKLEKVGGKRPNEGELRELLKKANISNYRLLSDKPNESGRWIEMHKFE